MERDWGEVRAGQVGGMDRPLQLGEKKSAF